MIGLATSRYRSGGGAAKTVVAACLRFGNLSRLFMLLGNQNKKKRNFIGVMTNQLKITIF
jgi:hypothetical protein